jgi:hypothetical protein
MKILGGDFFGLQEKLGQLVEGRFGDPTFGALSALAGTNQSRPGQFLEMMRNGRLADAQSPPQLAHAKSGTVFRITTVPLAATRETEKNREPVRMRQRLEGERRFLDVHTSIVIDISNDVKTRFQLFSTYPELTAATPSRA